MLLEYSLDQYLNEHSSIRMKPDIYNSAVVTLSCGHWGPLPPDSPKYALVLQIPSTCVDAHSVTLPTSHGPHAHTRPAIERRPKGGPTIRCRSWRVTRQNCVSMRLMNEHNTWPACRIRRSDLCGVTTPLLSGRPTSRPRQTVANNFMSWHVDSLRRKFPVDTFVEPSRRVLCCFVKHWFPVPHNLRYAVAFKPQSLPNSSAAFLCSHINTQSKSYQGQMTYVGRHLHLPLCILDTQTVIYQTAERRLVKSMSEVRSVLIESRKIHSDISTTSSLIVTGRSVPIFDPIHFWSTLISK